jgi:hypothetical protein
MFGGKKKKIQVKSVEEYLRGNDATDETGGSDDSLPLTDTQPIKATPKQGPKVRPFIIQAVVGIVALALLLTALSQISVLKSEVAEIQQRREGDVQALKAQVNDLSTKLGKAYSLLGEMTERVSSLERQIDTERAQRLKAAEAAAARKAAPTPADKKKKAVKPKG